MNIIKFLHAWDRKSIFLKLSTIEFVASMTYAAYLPFSVIILMDKGFNKATIGFIVSLTSLVLIFSVPFWGMISDRMHSLKKSFMICSAISALFILLIPMSNVFWYVCLVFCGFTFFQGAMVPLLDLLIVQELKTEIGISYGSIRLWGPISYSIFAFLLGRMIDSVALWIIFPIYTVLAMGTIILCSKLGKQPPPQHTHKVSISNIISLFCNYEYSSLLIFLIIFFTSLRASMVFLPVQLESLGGSFGDYGTVTFFASISEVPVYFLSNYLIRKIKPFKLIFIAAVFYILRIFFSTIAVNTIQFLLAQILQGPSMGLFMVGFLYYIDSLAPEGMKSTAQTIAVSVYSGISGILGSYLGGIYSEKYGLTAMFTLSIYISAAATIFFLCLYYGKKIFKKISNK